MKKIGIMGGLSPESTVAYYLHICRRYTELSGDVGFPEIVIYSVCLENYHAWRNADRWDLIINDLAKGMRYLERSDVDFALIATNTMHKVIRQVRERTRLPVLSIIDATIDALEEKAIKKVGLIGTRFTMRDDFFSAALEARGIGVVTPDDDGVGIIHGIIEDELVKGIIREESRRRYLVEIDKLTGRGAEGVVLGCTEIPSLIRQSDVAVPVFDTATIHAEKALRFSMGD